MRQAVSLIWLKAGCHICQHLTLHKSIQTQTSLLCFCIPKSSSQSTARNDQLLRPEISAVKKAFLTKVHIGVLANDEFGVGLILVNSIDRLLTWTGQNLYTEK